MTSQFDHSNESLPRQAAELTFAMILFEQEAAHQFLHSEAEGQKTGIDKFVFLPSWVATARSEVVPYLEALPGPALLFQTTARGVISLIMLDEVSGDRRRWAQKTLDNHLVGIDEMASQFLPPLQPNSKILLEIRGESHVISFEALRFWTQRFNCPTGWSLGAVRQDAPHGIAAQIMLISPDGRVTPTTHAMAPWHRPAW